MKNYTRATVSLLIILTLVFCGIFAAKEPSYLSTDAKQNKTKTVIIDAGHGGFDGGAVVGDVTEKDINLLIANRLIVLLKTAGFKVIATRTNDASTESDPSDTIANRKKSDLKNRLNLAKQNPDGILISIHLNKFSSPAARGAQMFCSPNNKDAARLAEQIKSNVVRLVEPDNRRTVKMGTKSTYLLYYSPIPTVIAECGFMSNPADLKNLTSSDYQAKMAFAIFCGILSYYN